MRRQKAARDRRGLRRPMRWVIAVSAAALFGFVGLLFIEVLMARGGRQLPGYSRVELDGIVGAGSRTPLRVTWIGDSTGQGVGASDPEHVLPRVVARGLGRPVQLTVLAKSGARVADVVDEQLPLLKDTRPQWVFVGIGGNDVTHLASRGAFRAAIEKILAGVAAMHPEHVIVLGIGEFASTPRFAEPLRFIAGVRSHELDTDLRNAANRHGALYVDIVGGTGPDFVRDPARYHSVDRFHPSDAGYALWAKATLASIASANLG
jgi:lysophospholipase L1-like esterase